MPLGRAKKNVEHGQWLQVDFKGTVGHKICFLAFFWFVKSDFVHYKKLCDENFEISRLADSMLRLVGSGVFLAISRNIYFNSNNVGRLPGYLRKLLLSLLLFFAMFYMQLCILSYALSTLIILHSRSYNIFVFTLLKTSLSKYFSFSDSQRKFISSVQVGTDEVTGEEGNNISPVWIKMCPKADHGILLPNPCSDMSIPNSKWNKNEC